MSSSYDIIIVGAGIVGAACAMECAREGLRTLVLERGCIGGGTTAAGMGHVVVMDDSEAQFALTSYSRSLWMALCPQLPPEVEYESCGTLWVAADQDEMAEVHRKHEFYEKRGVRSQVLDSSAVSSAEPNLRAGIAGGLLVMDDAVIYPPSAAHFMLEQAMQSGAELRVNVTVRAFLPQGGVQLADGSKISAYISLCATGPWSPELVSGLPVRKRKGHLVITDRAPGFVRHQLVELGYLKSAHSMGKDSVAFNIQPRTTGQMLIGSSRQFDAEDSGIDHPILSRMLLRAAEYLPGIGELSAIRAWTGHRAATPDKLPIIGPSVANDRLWLATGHEGLGITTSLGTGRLVADLVLKRTPRISAAPFAPLRFENSIMRHE